jgi:hypothetical protein
MNCRNILVLLAVSVFALLTVGSALSVPTARIYGPFTTSSPDSGTCGNDWATDTFDRYFHVTTTPNADNTYTVVEQFKRGSFLTLAGQSPGACDPRGTAGGTVAPGISGDMQGKFNIVVSGGLFNPNAECTTLNCGTTAGFVATVFGATATYNVTSFLLNYNAGVNGDWKNASADKGGNQGDITGTP